MSALLAIGAEVQSLAMVGGGCPDLLVSFRGKWFVLEVKSEGGMLEPSQEKWIARAKADVYVVRTPKDAIEAVTR